MAIDLFYTAVQDSARMKNFWQSCRPTKGGSTTAAPTYHGALALHVLLRQNSGYDRHL